MKYDMLSYEAVERIWDAFQGHDASVNEKYKTFKREDSYCYSDRDRFVAKFFKKYAGRCIAFADKVVIGSRVMDCFFYQEPESKFAPKYRAPDFYNNQGEPIFSAQKKYLCINYFRAVNEMYGTGYIEMSCVDAFGVRFNVRLDHTSLMYIQFKEITKLEFDMVANLFNDDRDPRPYQVERYMVRETTSKRGKKKQEVITEKVMVMAKDAEEARNVMPNTISVRREDA